MEQIVLDGKTLAKQIEEQLKVKVEKIKNELGFTPKLATIIVGNDPASQTYVRMKGKACARVGLDSVAVEMPENTTTEQLQLKIKILNRDREICGILLQHPVPKHIDERACFDTIELEKDVDGVNSQSFGEIAMGKNGFKCATPCGIMTLLKEYKIELEGKHAVVVGRSPILGLPLSNYLLNANCTVTTCHSKTKNLSKIIKSADIVVGAVGKPNFIKASWVKEGAIIIDAGYNYDENGKCVGDVEESAYLKANAYTPVPGGVGPMTISSLISQTVQSAENTYKLLRKVNFKY